MGECAPDGADAEVWQEGRAAAGHAERLRFGSEVELGLRGVDLGCGAYMFLFADGQMDAQKKHDKLFYLYVEAVLTVLLFS